MTIDLLRRWYLLTFIFHDIILPHSQIHESKIENRGENNKVENNGILKDSNVH